MCARVKATPALHYQSHSEGTEQKSLFRRYTKQTEFPEYISINTLSCSCRVFYVCTLYYIVQLHYEAGLGIL